MRFIISWNIDTFHMTNLRSTLRHCRTEHVIITIFRASTFWLGQQTETRCWISNFHQINLLSLFLSPSHTRIHAGTHVTAVHIHQYIHIHYTHMYKQWKICQCLSSYSAQQMSFYRNDSILIYKHTINIIITISLHMFHI